MRKDYHLHPMVLQCPERFDDFVQSALRQDIGEICITDHMPLSLSNAPDRIPRGCVREYCSRVRELAKRYEGTVKIRCGIEIDYHPSVTEEISRVLDEGDFDFVLGASHMHIFLNDFERYTFNDFAKYSLENSLWAAETGWFSAIAHLDMYRWAFERPKRFPLKDDGYSVDRYADLISELLDLLALRGIFLEINSHLASGKRDLSYIYPDAAVIAWALEKNVCFSFGSDAHSPDAVGAYLSELELHPLYGKVLEAWYCR